MSDVTDTTLCRLCFEHQHQLIAIFGDQGKQLCIAEILSKHFVYDRFNEEDDNSNVVCISCWETVRDFNLFYVKAESAFEQFGLSIKNSDNKNEENNSKKADNEPVSDQQLSVSEDNRINSLTEERCGSESDDDQSEINAPRKSEFIESSDEQFDLIDKRPPARRPKAQAGRQRKRNYLTLTVRPTQITEDDYKKIHRYFDMTCDHCSHKFKTIEEARLHYRKEHTVNGYLKCCNQQFKYPKDIFNHLEWHSNPLINQCDICQKVFKTAKAKSHHVLVHADEKNFSCDHCFKQFARKFLLDNHLKYYCTDSKKERRKRPKKTDGVVIDGTIPVKKKRLMTHDLISKIDKNLPNIKNKQKKEPQKFICDLCGLIYTAKTSLEYHQINHHQDAEKQKVQCNICNGWYVSKYIKRHISQHNDISVACKICQKIFKNDKNLKAHMKNSHLVSESERRLACNICEKRFLYPFHLKQHMITHTGGSLYKCTNCSKEFTRGRLFRIHQKTCCATDPIPLQVPAEHIVQINITL